MKFGPVSSEEALGSILAHSLTAGEMRLKKGHILRANHIQSLLDANISTVTVCRLGPDDVGEDAAADQLAATVSGAGLSKAVAFTGRVNISAVTSGILQYDRTELDRVNGVHEGITLAALPPFARVTARQMVATAKIIPFGIPKADLDQACPITPLLSVAPFQRTSLALIQTMLPGLKSGVLDKTEGVMAARGAALGADILPPMRAPHEIEPLAACLEAVLSAKTQDAPLIITIVGASAIVDRRDVIPAAIEAAGGEIEHFGMPVDPGNLLLLGRIRTVPIIGAPGCVRSPKPNGYDWVLERLVARVPTDRRAIMEMGSGGFLKEIALRPLPRAAISDQTPKQPLNRTPRIHGLLLAAGQSRRMGRRNKLLEDIDGAAMVRRAAETALSSGLDGLTVVTGHQETAVRRQLEGLSVAFASSPHFAQGLAETVKSGIASLPLEADGVMILLGDMPRLQRHTIEKLLAAFDPLEGRAICVPIHDGKRGNPVLFAKQFFPEILDLSGDSGAKSLLGAYADHVAEVPVDDPGVLLDLDTPEALEAARIQSD